MWECNGVSESCGCVFGGFGGDAEKNMKVFSEDGVDMSRQ